MNTKDTNQDKKNPENLENQYSYNQLIWDLIGYMQDSQKQQQQKIVELQSQIKLFKKANSNGIIYTNSLEKRIKELEGWIEELDEQVKFMDQKQSKQDISIENINKRLNQLEIEKAKDPQASGYKKLRTFMRFFGIGRSKLGKNESCFGLNRIMGTKTDAKAH